MIRPNNNPVEGGLSTAIKGPEINVAEVFMKQTLDYEVRVLLLV
jgi:hypothetical protein